MQRQKRMVQGDTKMVLGCEEGASGLDVPILRWERKHPARKVFGWKSLRNVEIGGSFCRRTLLRGACYQQNFSLTVSLTQARPHHTPCEPFDLMSCFMIIWMDDHMMLLSTMILVLIMMMPTCITGMRTQPPRTTPAAIPGFSSQSRIG